MQPVFCTISQRIFYYRFGTFTALHRKYAFFVPQIDAIARGLGSCYILMYFFVSLSKTNGLNFFDRGCSSRSASTRSFASSKLSKYITFVELLFL